MEWSTVHDPQTKNTFFPPQHRSPTINTIKYMFLCKKKVISATSVFNKLLHAAGELKSCAQELYLLYIICFTPAPCSEKQF